MDEITSQKTEEPTSSEIQSVKEVLREEFDRRIYELHTYISDLETILETSLTRWFVVPPVMGRTDFGYLNDIDFVVLTPLPTQQDYEQVSALTQRHLEERKVFFTPNFITEEEFQEMEVHTPEMFSWYQDRLSRPKPEGKKARYDGFFDQAEKLESRLRKSLSPAEKEKLRQERLKTAGQFIKEAQSEVEIIAWTVSGSTTGNLEKFGTSSDLDLDILTDPKDEDQERICWRHLHQYLTWKYAEEKGIKIDCGEWTIKHLKQFSRVNPKMKKFFERMFDIKLGS